MHNWWNYLVTLDFATGISEADTIELEEGEKISNEYIKVRYNSGKVEKIKLSELEDTLKIDNEKIVSFKNGKLVGKKEGETFIEFAIDGLYGQIDVEVLEADYEEENKFTFHGNCITCNMYYAFWRDEHLLLFV